MAVQKLADASATSNTSRTTNYTNYTNYTQARQPILRQGRQDDNSAQRRTLATKVRRKATHCSARRSQLPAATTGASIPLTQLLWLLCCLCCSQLAHNTMADCPNVCECKWKSGKESVLCLNANLTHIPAPLDAGTQVLDLTGNEIVQIPHDTFAAAQLLNLQKVYLAKCRLRHIERYAFRKLINLVELDLSYNQLTSIPAQALEAVPELREIKLSANPIYRVPNDAFAKVPQLVRLDLSDCRLTAVEVRAFAGLETSLEWLKLDGNKLSEIRSGTITSLTNLHGIELARNQWNCSCALRPLRAWMLQQNIPCGIPPMCRAPERLAGKPWDKIDLDEFACVPQIIATDTTAHGVEGRNVTMSCFVEGVPEPSVRWLVKNRVIANLSASGDPMASPRTAAATQGRKTYVVNMLRNASNLTILTADMQDAGIYTCAAENKAGKVEASVTLAVSRRPPDAPLGAKIILLCVFTALLFVVGSSFAAICFCSLRRKRKMRLWNSVPPARTESYEKIEMTARVGGVVGGKPDLGGGASCGGGSGTGAGLFHDDDDNYLRSTTTPLNSDGGESGVAVVNPSGGSCGGNSGGIKRNGDYLHVSTHCDDEGTGCEDNDRMEAQLQHHHQQQQHQQHQQQQQQQQSRKTSLSALPACSTVGVSASASAAIAATTASSGATRWTTSPQAMKRKTSSAASATNNSTLEQETDLHIPRLIDIGTESTSSSISSQVDAAARLGGVGYVTWKTTPIATTKITSPHSKQRTYYGNDDVTTSVFCSSDGAEPDLFDSNYPDLLDIAKYAVAQAAQSNANYQNGGGVTNGHGGLCTLPRKLKNTGKYFKNSSDSQSPLLADNSSKYGSSTLGDGSFINEAMGLGRRYSAESSYSNYASTTTYTSGQRSNSFLNLVQSAHHKAGLGLGIGVGLSALAGSHVISSATLGAHKMNNNGNNGNNNSNNNHNNNTNRRNPSLPSSPVHEEFGQQHQRSFSSAATPLLDFTALATRASGGIAAAAAAAGTATSVATVPGGPLAHTLNSTTTSSSVAAYDYHAAQLERFLEEYRNLQDQLCKMKETCDTIRKKETPLRVSVGQSAQLADPVMFNAAMTANNAAAHSPKPSTTLKTKALLPGQPPDPPPYWLHRNAMLKRLNDSSSPSPTTQTTGQAADIFKS